MHSAMPVAAAAWPIRRQKPVYLGQQPFHINRFRYITVKAIRHQLVSISGQGMGGQSQGNWGQPQQGMQSQQPINQPRSAPQQNMQQQQGGSTYRDSSIIDGEAREVTPEAKKIEMKDVKKN